jgi:TPR repeat protein
MGLWDAIFHTSVKEEDKRRFSEALALYNSCPTSVGNPSAETLSAAKENLSEMHELAQRGYEPAQKFLRDVEECERALAAYDCEYYQEALGSLLKLADSGFAAAAEMVGAMYWQGMSALMGIETAIHYLLIAASQGRPAAGSYLASAYAADSPSSDAAKYFRWALWSAEKNVPDAQRAVGDAYVRGFGVERDFQKAAYWLEKASRQEDPQAQYMLACLYECGDGFPRDRAESAYWLKKAAENGHEKARHFWATSGDLMSVT